LIMRKYGIVLLSVILTAAMLLSACDSKSSGGAAAGTSSAGASEQASQQAEQPKLKNNIKLSKIRGIVGDRVDFAVNELEPNQPAQLIWVGYEGNWDVQNLYEVIGPVYQEEEIVLAEGTSDANGEWKGTFTVPEEYGGDITIAVKSGGVRIGQTVFTLDPSFEMTPTSGPVGTEITIKVKGLGWSTYFRNWQLTYDNKYTGLVSAIATNGTAEAKIRAAGPPGKHYIRLRTGYLGMPYINYLQSPYPDKPAPEFVFEVTDEKPANTESYVEPIPREAGKGLVMPDLVNKPGVEVALDKSEGVVGDPVVLTAKGLPKNSKVDLVWNSMKGSRVTNLGFTEHVTVLDSVTTDGNGNLVYNFQVPDDLGGIPHRLDLKVGDEIYGQAYLRILPSIVEFYPKSGPVGTKINVKIKGGGWTEFDNAYYLTYDNAYAGYMCAFNSQGDLTFDVVATGEPGYHIIDLYPGIYRQKEKATDMTLIPQLTYSTDHPGSQMPAIRMMFEITE